jgi:hypothetical protein
MRSGRDRGTRHRRTGQRCWRATGWDTPHLEDAVETAHRAPTIDILFYFCSPSKEASSSDV